MAQVFRVWNESLQRAEALKLLSPKLAADREFVKRFLREAQTAAKLQHQNIATIYAVSPQSEAQPYFTMELLDGVDLADLLQQRGGRLSEQEAIAWLKQVAAGLDYAHSKGVIHRDIKPANVLVTREGVAKLVDFGIARAAETNGDARLTQTGMIVGTPAYMSTEQARGDAEITPASDQYSLACVAFELLTGHPPFTENAETSSMQVLMHHVQSIPPDPRDFGLSEGVRDALLQALRKDPGQRFSSCLEFVTALEAPPSAPVAPPPVRQSASKLGPLVLGIAVLGLGLIGYSVYSKNAEPAPTSSVAADSLETPAPSGDFDASRLKGHWKGTLGSSGKPAEFVVESAESKTFSGKMYVTPPGDSTRIITFHGSVTDTSARAFQFTETESSYPNWKLAENTGNVSEDGNTLTGQGIDDRKEPYPWRFVRSSDLDSPRIVRSTPEPTPRPTSEPLPSLRFTPEPTSAPIRRNIDASLSEIRSAYSASDSAYDRKDADGHMFPYASNWRGPGGDTYRSSLNYHRDKFAKNAAGTYSMQTEILGSRQDGDDIVVEVRVQVVTDGGRYDTQQEDTWRLREGNWKCVRTRKR